MSSLPEAIRHFFVKEGTDGRTLVAVSGGIDSTALLLALTRLGIALEAAHINHHLRGTESDGDEQFVRDLCARLGVPLHVADGTLDPGAVRARGIEAAAREVRYERLRALRESVGARFVATAHQKNDQAETVLMRLLSGSGLAGLRGIHPVRSDGFIRPMLDVSRAEAEEFLRSNGIEARVDSSNADARFLRNRVRALLATLGGVDALSAVAAEAREQWPLVEAVIDTAERAGLEVKDTETRFRTWPGERWLRSALLQRHIRRLDPHARDFDAARLALEVDELKRTTVTKNLELIRRDGVLVLRRHFSNVPPYEVAVHAGACAYIAEVDLTMHVTREEAGGQSIQLPRGATPDFVVRNRRSGDRFQPLGMRTPKKLKDFLIDRKVDVELRDRLPLLVWNGEIAWIAGVEVSERFKLSDGNGDRYQVWTVAGPSR